MAEIRQEEELDTLIIPENFIDTGRCFNGMFRTRNLIEGALFAFLPGYFLVNSSMPLQQKIVVTTIVVGLILVLFINGVNDESFLEFVYHAFVYRDKKRVAKYNPRVKKEALPNYLADNSTELPREKIIRLYKELFNKGDDKPEEAVSRDIYDPMYQEFFEDDLGYVETPQDLKSHSELRKEARDRKKQEKVAKAEAKAARKKADLEQKKKNKRELAKLEKLSRETEKAIKKERARLKKEQNRK